MTYLLLCFYWPLKCYISRRVRKFLLLFVGGGETFRLSRLLRKVNLSITATTLTQQSVPVGVGRGLVGPTHWGYNRVYEAVEWRARRCSRPLHQVDINQVSETAEKKNKQKIKFNHNPMSHGSSDQSCSRLVFTAKAHYYSHWDRKTPAWCRTVKIKHTNPSNFHNDDRKGSNRQNSKWTDSSTQWTVMATRLWSTPQRTAGTHNITSVAITPGNKNWTNGQNMCGSCDFDWQIAFITVTASAAAGHDVNSH